MGIGWTNGNGEGAWAPSVSVLDRLLLLFLLEGLHLTDVGLHSLGNLVTLGETIGDLVLVVPDDDPSFGLELSFLCCSTL